MSCLTAWLMRVKPSETGLQLMISPHVNLWPWGCSCVGNRADHYGYTTSMHIHFLVTIICRLEKHPYAWSHSTTESNRGLALTQNMTRIQRSRQTSHACEHPLDTQPTHKH